MGFTKATGDYIDQATLTEISAGIDWQTTPKTSAFTAVSGEGYLVDTTSAAITITLPTSPTAGDEIIITDYASNASTNNITLDPGTLNLRGATDDFVMSANNQSVSLLYSGATKGWLITSDVVGGTSAPNLAVEYLVVAGGGGGGARYGGGGGAGGYLSNYDGTTVNLFEATSYTVTIGAGGSGGTGGANGGPGSAGSNSVFDTITSTGGGGGSGADSGPATNGGSGGGGSAGDASAGTGVSGQGFDGGDYTNPSNYYYAGGGGGASEVGETASTSRRGDGGDGLPNGITGTSTYYAGGGGGGSHNPTPSGGGGSGGLGGGGNAGAIGLQQVGAAGTANTGGGGGGGSTTTGGSTSTNGGAGGSGIVIVRYPDYYDITVGSGLTTGTLNTTVGTGEKYTTFVSGTGTIQFGAA